MWIKNIASSFFRGKQWYKQHYQFWEKYLVLNNENLSKFQKNLSNDVKNLLESNHISFLEEIKEDTGFIIQEKTAKIITIKLTNVKDSTFWIYFDGSRYKLKGKNHNYEDINYLKPEELIDRYIKEVKKILNIN
ncbi:hypothetical protein NAT47_03010 [Flavobacterium sp. HXWNR69]|uniref:Phage protein n=1 Tax=Flavobacterium fragile TaxID=2949085 RepID=A0ABT0TEH4_9FLAO|nr:hypothetical protein [Flavobacterium sp. HXWNR69]MCL9769376.1 hypothetical protein [Flavobacterium sp. HXWNR69]